jgi:hypothetical protein
MSHSKTQGKASIGTVLLLCVVAGLAVMFFWNMSKEDDAKKIRAVLQQNQQFGEILASRIGERADRNGESTQEDLDRAAGYYDDYVAQMRKIDTHECPRDFAEAFYRYMAAYEDEAQVMHAHPHIPTGEQAFVAGVEGGLEGDPGRQVRELKAEIETWDKRRREKADRASQAEQEMKAIATRYGAL